MKCKIWQQTFVPSYPVLVCGGRNHLGTIKCDDRVNFHTDSAAHMLERARSTSASRAVAADTGSSALASGAESRCFYQALPASRLWLQHAGWKCFMALCWVLAAVVSPLATRKTKLFTSITPHLSPIPASVAISCAVSVSWLAPFFFFFQL